VDRVWARDSARPGVTERQKPDGLRTFPRGSEPRENRPFHAGKGITEQSLSGEELRSVRVGAMLGRPVNAAGVGFSFFIFSSFIVFFWFFISFFSFLQF
jgi:hypothetical protein